MSAALDEESLLIRIRRDIAESEKFMAEQRKLINEADKIRIDRYLAPVIAIGGICVGILSMAVALTVALIRH